jgi:hypothetical protein
MLGQLRNSRRSGVFSVPSRAVTSPALPHIALPRLLPGNSYKRLDDMSGEGSRDRVSSDATIEVFPACQIKGL